MRKLSVIVVVCFFPLQILMIVSMLVAKTVVPV